jgi:hypothetical protein
MDEAEAFAVGSFERWVGGVRDWSRAAIAVGVAVGTVRRAVVDAGPGDGEGVVAARLSVEVVKPEKGYHEWWIVPRVVERKS